MREVEEEGSVGVALPLKALVAEGRGERLGLGLSAALREAEEVWLGEGVSVPPLCCVAVAAAAVAEWQAVSVGREEEGLAAADSLADTLLEAHPLLLLLQLALADTEKLLLPVGLAEGEGAAERERLLLALTLPRVPLLLAAAEALRKELGLGLAAAESVAH